MTGKGEVWHVTIRRGHDVLCNYSCKCKTAYNNEARMMSIDTSCMGMQAELTELERVWEIPVADVTLDRLIGQGAAGEVWVGAWQGVRVAVKKINSSGLFDDEEILRDFEKEIKVIRRRRGYFHVIVSMFH